MTKPLRAVLIGCFLTAWAVVNRITQELGRGSAGTPAEWIDMTGSGGLAVCDRHRRQYDERDDLGPFVWTALIDGSHDV